MLATNYDSKPLKLTNMKKLAFLLGALLGLSFGGTRALATPLLESVGEPYETGSFATGLINYSGFATFTSLEAFIVSETGQGSFEYQGLDVNGSAGSVINPTYSLWNGASSGSGNFQFYLDGNATGAMTIDVIAGGSGTGVAFNVRLFYTDGSLSNYQVGTFNHPYDRTSVPDAGSTVALLGLALCGAVAVRRRLNLT